MTQPEPEPGSPLKPWQWAELWAMVLVIAVQLWLYRISVPAAAGWGLLVPVLGFHMYCWMAPLVRQQGTRDGSDGHEHP